MRLEIVIPCFNEEDVLQETERRMSHLLDGLISERKIAKDSRILFVDDGSKDGTWALIEKFSASNARFCGMRLSRNRGHQIALMAGLFESVGDAVVSIDADLQDDPLAIVAMIDKFFGGADIVYGVRNRRDSDSAFKRISALVFYKLMKVLGAKTVDNHADFRLLSRRAIDCLRGFSEVNLFLRGIVPLIGFKSECVYYDRIQRFAGQSKYPFRKMFALALEAITSFSVVPLRIIAFVGFMVFLGSLFVTAWALWLKLIVGNALPGWTSIVLPMYFLGGIQIFCIGILGEYLGKIYQEVKSRPLYFIEKTTGQVNARET